jgi:hypothetical protein
LSLLALAALLLVMAALLGGALGVRRLAAPGAAATPPGWLRLLHGALGLGGVVALRLALAGPPRGVAAGVGNFGWIAVGTLGIAFLLGLLVWLLGRVWRPGQGLMAGLHATVALLGLAILLVYLLLG